MKRPPLANLLFLLVVSLLLTACGGGSGGGGTLGGDPVDPGAGVADAAPTITLTLIDGAGVAITEINGTEEGTAQVVVRDTEGNVVQGNLVTFSTTIGLLAGNGAAVTNDSGVATITVTAGTRQGAGELSASTAVEEGTVVTSLTSDAVAFQTDGQGSTTDSQTLEVSFVLDPMTVSRDNPGTATLTLLDDEENPLSGAIVSFQTSSGDLSADAVFTNALGVATTTVSAGTAAGLATLDASVIYGNEEIDADSINYITDGDAVATLELSLVADGGGGGQGGATTTIDFDSPGTVTATLLGADGAPIEGAIVNFTLTGAFGVLQNSQVSTDSNGQASVEVGAGTVEGFGEVSATAVVDGSVVASDFTEPVTFFTEGDDEPDPGSGTNNYDITLALVNGDDIDINPPLIDSSNPGTLKATVTDAQSDPVENVIVRFTAALGDPASATALTDATGVATVTLTAADTDGAASATATIVVDNQDFASDSLNYTVDVLSSGESSVVLALAPTTISRATPGAVTLTLEDEDGMAIPDAIVVFTASTGNLSATAAFTDNGGVATTTLTAGTSSGNGTLDATVTVNGDSLSSNTVNFVTAGDEAASLDLSLDNASITAAADGTVTAEVVGSDGEAAEGVIVNFTLVGNGELSASQSITDGTGIATVTLTAGTSAGAGTITAAATVAGANVVSAAPVTFNTAGDDDPPVGSGENYTIAIALVDSLGAAIDPPDIDASNPGVLQATVKDAQNNAVEGVIIQFIATLGTLSPPTGSALTDAAGIATVELTAGETAGAGTATATIVVGGTNYDTDSLTYSIEVTDAYNLGMAWTAGPPTDNPPTNILRGDPAEVTVTLLDGADPVVGAVVEFSASTGVLSETTLFTNGAGQATTTISAGTSGLSAGTLDATVTIGTTVLNADTLNFITAGDAFASLELTLDPVDTDVEAATSIQAVATVTGSDGEPIPDVLVTFALSGEVGSLAQTQKRTIAVTGAAKVTLDAGTIEGFGEVTATADVEGTGLSADPIEFYSAGDGPFAGQGTSNLNIALILVDSDGDEFTKPYSIDADNPGTLQTTVTDAQGDPVPEIVVQFEAGLGDLFPLNGLALTNNAGEAVASLTAGSVPGAGVAKAFITFDGQTFDSDSITFATEGNGGDTAIVMTLTFEDATPASEGNIVTSAAPGTLTITVEDGGGTQLPLRSADITTSLGQITESSTCADDGLGETTLTGLKTNSEGKIEVTVCGYTQVGTGNIAVRVGDTIETEQFEVAIANLQIGTFAGAVFNAEEMDISIPVVPTKGKSDVTVTVVDGDEIRIPDISISFTSFCAEQGLATITSTVISDDTAGSEGEATATYQAAEGCEGDDTITATETSSGARATGTIEVLAPEIGSITFVEVEHSTIQIKESGGTEATDVTFQVLDVNGDGVKEQDVTFELTNEVGGLSLVSTTGTTLATEGFEGLVSATVRAGYIPTTVRVRASTIVEVDEDQDGECDDANPVDGVCDTQVLSTLSERLSVNTGIADQNSMSISTPVANIEGDNLDGITTQINIRLSDAFNNPVADQTAVAFQTELGSIHPSCNTSEGSCFVTFTTQDPRGPLNPNVSFRTLGNDNCPAERINQETVTIVTLGGDAVGETNYRINTNRTVVVKEDDGFGNLSYLDEGPGDDYVVDTDGGGITCVTCAFGDELLITYNRAWVDEDPYDIAGETITIDAALTGATAAVVDTDIAPEVYDANDALLVEGTDYTVNALGTGITCVATSTECEDGDTLTISYDEVTAGVERTHIISNPGVATKPWTNDSSVPCRASWRNPTANASGYNGGLGQPYGGRSTILAYALGEESFIDTNGNGQYDFNEPFVDLPEAFLDKNEDGVFNNGAGPATDDARTLASPECYGPVAPISNPDQTLNKCYQDGGEEETFIDFGAEPLNGLFDAGNGIYNGTLCPKQVSDDPDICTTLPCLETERYCTRELVSIRREIQVLMSGSFANFGIRDAFNGELIIGVDITGALAFNEYTALSSVTANDGSTIGAGTPFTIGDDDSATEAPPGTGETEFLTSGYSTILVDIADGYNGYLPATAGVSVSSGTGGCAINNSPSGDVGNTNGFGFSVIGISVAAADDDGGGAPITIQVDTDDGGATSLTSFGCVF